LNAKTLATLGYVVAGREVCAKTPSIRAAMHNAGTPCAGDDGRFAAAAQCRDDFDLFKRMATCLRSLKRRKDRPLYVQGEVGRHSGCHPVPSDRAMET